MISSQHSHRDFPDPKEAPPCQTPGANASTPNTRSNAAVFARDAVIQNERTGIADQAERRRKALPRTNRLDKDIAAAASIGDSNRPLTGYSSPAATGISSTL